MKTTAKKLEVQKKDSVGVKPIWFSAWEFDKLPTPLWAVFLNRVIMDLQEMMPSVEMKNKIKAIGKGILLFSANILMSKTIGTNTEDIEKIKDNVWEDIKRVDCLREDLSVFIDTALENDDQHRKRVAIFIDDLDRCLPRSNVLRYLNPLSFF